MLYTQDFEGNQVNGLTIYGDWHDWEARTEPDGNHIFCNTNNMIGTVATIGTHLWTNYAIELRVKSTAQQDDSDISLSARSNYDTGVSYYGSINFSSSEVGLSLSEPYIPLLHADVNISPDTWYTIRREVAGISLKFFLNDFQIGSGYDGHLTQGRTGFALSKDLLVCLDDIHAWALDPDGQVAKGVPSEGSMPRSLTDRLASHKYPKLFNQNQDWDPKGGVLEQAFSWDLLTFSQEIISNEWAYLGPNGAIRYQNPDVVILATFSVQEYYPEGNSRTGEPFVTAFQPDWTLHDIYGKPYHVFYYKNYGTWSTTINLSSGVNRFIPEYINSTSMNTGLFDGIFYDGISEDWSGLTLYISNPENGWADVNNDGKPDTVAQVNAAFDEGTITLLSESRRVFPPDTLITGNAGEGGLLLEKNATQDTIFAGLLNGRMIEGFLSGYVSSDDWLKNMRNYYLMQEASSDPKIPMVMAYCTGTDYDNLRYVLASALMFDGYFTCTNNQPKDSLPYTATWWYDEYSVNLATGQAEKSLDSKGYLGMPVSEAYNPENPTEKLSAFLIRNDPSVIARSWRRDFEHGIVLINPGWEARSVDLNGTYRKIKGEKDPAFNDGSQETRIDLGPKSGVILLNLP